MNTIIDPQRLAADLRDAVVAVAGVSRCSSGSVIEVTTQFAGGSVRGIRLAGDVVEIYVVLNALPIPVITERVHQVAAAILRQYGDQRPIRVIVTDLELSALPIA